MDEKIKKIILEAIKKKASDIHISVNQSPVIRVDTKLEPVVSAGILSDDDVRKIALSLVSDENWQVFLREKDIDFAYGFNEEARFRVNVYKERGNLAIAMRLVPKNIRTIEELNLPKVLYKITEAKQGFVLVTGASSQGKSTTLAALINEINKNKRLHIITIEDPIEYIFENKKSLIHQREIRVDAIDFPGALRAALREDPDVVMVGEMRDLETISTAITAAETGHLVFATLHTNSAAQTIHRIIDVFPSHQQNQIKAQLSSSLLAIISQKLIYTAEKDVIPVCEVMFNNSAIGNLIREGKIYEIPSVIETSADEGMVPANKALAELVLAGKLSLREALKYSINPDDLEARLEKF